MLFRILKKDLKRKKVMNAILLCFILLATMFVASGISNVVSVMNGTNSYLDKAGIGDYVVISMGADSKASIDEILHEMESIRDYRIEPVVLGEKSNLKDMHGEKLEAKNSVIYQSIEDSRLKFFDKENKQITQIKPGHAYATGDFIAFLDSDDYIEKNAYEEMYNKAIEENADYVECDFIWEFPNKIRVDKQYTYKNKKEMLSFVRVVAWNKLIKRQLIIDNNLEFPKGLRYEDVEFTYKLIPFVN